MSELMLDVSQAEELKMAFRRENYTNGLIKKMCEKDSKLGDFKNVLLGYAEIKPIENIIDCDASPWLPNEKCKIEEHQKGGLFKWNPVEQAKPKHQYHSEKQQGGKIEGIEGNDLRKELAGKPVLNANVLDWLLKEENRKFIPDEWKNGRTIFFWGTIYSFSDPSDRLRVRGLIWLGDRWDWRWRWLLNGWYETHPAILRASSSVRS